MRRYQLCNSGIMYPSPPLKVCGFLDVTKLQPFQVYEPTKQSPNVSCSFLDHLEHFETSLFDLEKQLHQCIRKDPIYSSLEGNFYLAVGGNLFSWVIVNAPSSTLLLDLLKTVRPWSFYEFDRDRWPMIADMTCHTFAQGSRMSCTSGR